MAEDRAVAEASMTESPTATTCDPETCGWSSLGQAAPMGPTPTPPDAAAGAAGGAAVVPRAPVVVLPPGLPAASVGGEGGPAVGAGAGGGEVGPAGVAGPVGAVCATGDDCDAALTRWPSATWRSSPAGAAGAG